MKGNIRTLLILAALLAPGPGFARPAPCPFAGQAMMLVTRLYFGQDEGGKPLAAGQWEDFLARSVTPRFPGGFTVTDAKGQWRDPKTRTIVWEAAKVVEIAIPDGPDARRRIAELAGLYRTRFHQQAVGIVSTAACGAF